MARISQGVADVLGSDHAPHTIEEKEKPYPASPSGMPGVQTLLPVMLNHVAQGRMSLERLVDLTSAGAQRVFGVANKGRMAEGYDGDVTLVDLKMKRVLRHEDMRSRCGWTPFDGMEVTGWPKATIIRGRVVMRDGRDYQSIARRSLPVYGVPLGFGFSAQAARTAWRSASALAGSTARDTNRSGDSAVSSGPAHGVVSMARFGRQWIAGVAGIANSSTMLTPWSGRGWISQGAPLGGHHPGIDGDGLAAGKGEGGQVALPAGHGHADAQAVETAGGDVLFAGAGIDQDFVAMAGGMPQVGAVAAAGGGIDTQKGQVPGVCGGQRFPAALDELETGGPGAVSGAHFQMQGAVNARVGVDRSLVGRRRNGLQGRRIVVGMQPFVDAIAAAEQQQGQDTGQPFAHHPFSPFDKKPARRVAPRVLVVTSLSAA